jgi:hypothetical protein
VREKEAAEVIRRISLNRLIEGGAAIFAHENINHRKATGGSADKIPLIRVRLRVWNMS